MIPYGQKYRERPKCRKEIEKFMSDGVTLDEISTSNRYSNGLQSQARKMLSEVKYGT